MLDSYQLSAGFKEKGHVRQLTVAALKWHKISILVDPK